MKVTVKGGTMSTEEQREYAKYIKQKHPDKYISELELTIDGEYVDMRFEYDNIPFERVRRITGYLVGTLDRWNNGKRAEEHDRVKHGITENINN